MKQSPYFNINYGWPYGSDGWNVGMDENLLVLSFLNAHQVLGIVPSVPTNPAEGDSYVISSDNTARFYSDETWHIVYPADGWEFQAKDTELYWVFEQGNLVQRVNPDELVPQVQTLSSRIGAAEGRLDSVDDQLQPLEDIPPRVLELENNSATTEQFNQLSQTVSALEDSTSDMNETFEGLQNSFVELQDSVEAKIDGVVAGEGMSVDSTDPLNPVISLDESSLAPVALSGAYSDLTGTPTLGSASSQDSSAFDPAGSAESVNTSLTTLINERMSAAARAAIDALDPATATLEDLITALQLP